VDRSTGRQRPFKPGLGGCLLWFLIVVAVLLIVALFVGGFRKGTPSSLDRPSAPAVTAPAATGPAATGPAATGQVAVTGRARLSVLGSGRLLQAQ